MVVTLPQRRVTKHRSEVSKMIEWALETWAVNVCSRAERYSLNLIAGLLANDHEDSAAMSLVQFATFGMMSLRGVDRDAGEPPTRIDALLDLIHVVGSDHHSADDFYDGVENVRSTP